MSLDTPSERPPAPAPLRLNETFDLSDLGRSQKPDVAGLSQQTREETGSPGGDKQPPERRNSSSGNGALTLTSKETLQSPDTMHSPSPGDADPQVHSRPSSTHASGRSNGVATEHPTACRGSSRQERTGPVEGAAAPPETQQTAADGGPQLLSTISQITDYDSSTSDSAEAAAARAHGSPLRVVLASRIPRRLSSPGLPAAPLAASRDMSPHGGDPASSRLPVPRGRQHADGQESPRRGSLASAHGRRISETDGPALRPSSSRPPSVAPADGPARRWGPGAVPTPTGRGAPPVPTHRQTAERADTPTGQSSPPSPPEN